MQPALTISIDLELAWGNWDNITDRKLALVEEAERPICNRLLEIFDRYDLPVTWAFVGALLDPQSAQGRPGRERHWYAPDIIEAIMSSKTRHDLGSHGGRHKYFDLIGEAEAAEDLAFARAIHDEAGLDFRSFVYPRNRVARHDQVAAAGISVYRGEDEAWHQRVRDRSRIAGRAANLADKAFAVSPEAVRPEAHEGMTNLPGSMLFLGRDGLRRFVGRSALARQLEKGMRAASKDAGVFHLWFHPSNFYHRRDEQFAVMENFLKDATKERADGRIDVRTMASFA